MGLLFSQAYEEVLKDFLEWYSQYSLSEEEALRIVRIYCRMKEEQKTEE